ncbi:MAG: glycoside hydrolase family 1 protein [Candidatus Omnitrophota bacterium]|nr:MAG: glycoside hydrolase family 1 protein [Candidatus Omnitrophota bacterium]
MQVYFPSSFLWGAALSSYQCEGQNYNCDWYLWEKEKNLEPAAKACEHYRLFRSDFELARQLNLNSLRISLEWSRIYSDPDTVVEKEIAHYWQVLDTLGDFKIKPLVTLHHFTNPLWFMGKDGWLVLRNIDYFLKYLCKAVEALHEKVDTWLIFNEPLVYIYNGFIEGIWPPGKRSVSDAKKALANIEAAYIEGYRHIKRIYRNEGKTVEVSLAKNLRDFLPAPGVQKPLNCLAASLRSYLFNFRLLDRLAKRNCLDFLGINYYCREYDRFKGVLGEELKEVVGAGRKNALGWYVNSQSFYKLLVKLKRYYLPIIITENGTAEKREQLYELYLTNHLESVGRAILDGVNIKGYLWWSLLDNFEWDKGFWPRFGLVEVDYSNSKRRIKPFAHIYAKICKERKLET